MKEKTNIEKKETKYTRRVGRGGSWRLGFPPRLGYSNDIRAKVYTSYDLGFRLVLQTKEKK